VNTQKESQFVKPGYCGDFKKFKTHGKEQISGILFFNGGNVLFKELPSNIMVTRNPN